MRKSKSSTKVRESCPFCQPQLFVVKKVVTFSKYLIIPLISWNLPTCAID